MGYLSLLFAEKYKAILAQFCRVLYLPQMLKFILFYSLDYLYLRLFKKGNSFREGGPNLGFFHIEVIIICWFLS